MSAAGRSPRTIVSYVQVVRLVVASAVDEEGEQIYPRKWNYEFIQLPIVCREKQHRPAVADADLNRILPKVKHRYAALFALLARTGLRIGAALALCKTDFGPEFRVLHVRRSFWRGQEQQPKTSNAIRSVDMPAGLALFLKTYAATGKGNLLFRTADGRPLMPRNLLRVLHHHLDRKVGFHAFRRFRLTWLRKNAVPKDLERFWMGHAPEKVGDLYSKRKDDVAFRQEWAERAGLGFELVHKSTQNAAEVVAAKAA